MERKEDLPEDKELNKIKDSRKKGERCVGLCFIMRKRGMDVDLHLQKLQKERPCVGLCYLLKKKKDELKNIEE